MTRSALPEHINDPEEIEQAFPDDSDNGPFIRRLKKATKHWFAFSFRANEWWARWRYMPTVLFALRGKGIWRFEDDTRDFPFGQTFSRIVLWAPPRCYLSRVQYWSRWHFAVQWPLQITFHIYWKAADVPHPYERPKGMTIKRMFYAYGPVHRDADAVYWFPSGYIGGKWK